MKVLDFLSGFEIPEIVQFKSPNPGSIFVEIKPSKSEIETFGFWLEKDASTTLFNLSDIFKACQTKYWALVGNIEMAEYIQDSDYFTIQNNTIQQ